MSVVERLRAYKHPLGPSPVERGQLEHCGGTARHPYNHLVSENRDRGDRYGVLRDHLWRLFRVECGRAGGVG